MSATDDKQTDERDQAIKDYVRRYMKVMLGLEFEDDDFPDKPIQWDIVDDDGNVIKTVYR